MITVNINGVEVTMPGAAKVDWNALPNEKLTGVSLAYHYGRNDGRPLHWSWPIEIDAR